MLAGGPYAPSSNIVDYFKALKAGPTAGGIFFAQTNLHVPEAQQAVVILSTANPCAAWMNGHQVYSRWLRPLYHELTDGFAFRIPVELQAGWNSLLLKFLHNAEMDRAGQFTCRVERPRGGQVAGMLENPRRLPAEGRERSGGFRWLRISVPAVAGALRLPGLEKSWEVWIDGTRRSPS